MPVGIKVRAAIIALLPSIFGMASPGDAFGASSAGADAPRHMAHVDGVAIESVELYVGTKHETVPFRDLPRRVLAPGRVRLEWTTLHGSGTAIEIPVCAGRRGLRIDGVPTELAEGPAIVPAPTHETHVHSWALDIDVSAYERRVACGAPIRVGTPKWSRAGLGVQSFASPHPNGGGAATIYVPTRHDERPPMLVGVHPWNGSRLTYAAYSELIEAAEREGVILLLPNGLGNSLYVEAAEDEVLRAIDDAMSDYAIDPARVSIWGASMGGQGACTIAWHNPDRFIGVTSLFGDARFDVRGYVKSILPTEASAHAVNPIDVIDNARHLSTWLIHGDADRISPVRESDELAAALRSRRYDVRYDRPTGRGHEGLLVAENVAEIVKRARAQSRPASPARVTYRSVRARDLGAYGVTIERRGPGDAFVDIERDASSLTVRSIENVRRLLLSSSKWGEKRAVTFGAGAGGSGTVEVDWSVP